LDNDDVAIVDYFIDVLGLGPETDLGHTWQRGVNLPVRLDFLLYVAIVSCSPAMVKMIMHHFNNKLPPDLVVEGNTMLCALCVRTSFVDSEMEDIASILLSAGADVNAKNIYLQTPLGFAVQLNKLELIRILLDTTYTKSPTDLHGPLRQCLHTLSSKTCIPILNLFLKAKPDLLLFPHDLTTSDTNILHVICGCPEMDRDDLINKQVWDSILHHFNTLPGGPEHLKACMDHKVPPLQHTPLHTAVHSGNVVAARFLLDCKANINSCNFISQTPLDVATNRNWNENKKFRLEYPQHDKLAEQESDLLQSTLYQKNTQDLIELLESRGGKKGHEQLDDRGTQPCI
jgi:ankyrin repeat protein